MTWDVFCRVIDNFGDLGVCLRLARDLGSRGMAVRLWVDDPAALAWMQPADAAGVHIVHWTAAPPAHEPGDVVIEAFGCDPPDTFVARMQRERPPVWINLEYLSAELYVEKCHGLPSPQQSGPGAGLVKWFFYPGFTDATGGLLRERDLMARRQAFDRVAWLAARGVMLRSGETCIGLFCYDGSPVDRLLAALSDGPPALVLAAPGAAQRQVESILGPSLSRAAVRAVAVPWLAQPDFDHLLWSTDLNFVRGEDSFVRAQWAGSPFVWQIYPQADGAHPTKLDAFLVRLVDGAPPSLAARLTAFWHAWNGLGAWVPPPSAGERDEWGACARAWRDKLLAQADLASRLIGFVREKR